MDEEEAFETIKNLEQYIGLEDSLDILVMASGKRDTAIATVFPGGLSKDFRDGLEELSRFFDFHYLIREKEEDVLEDATVYFSRISETLDEVSEEMTQRELGQFLDYPEDAVEAFTTDNTTTEVFQKFQQMMEDEGVDDEEALNFIENSGKSYLERFSEFLDEITGEELTRQERKLLNFVPYVPAPEKESVLNAVNLGRERRELLEELDSDTGDYFIQELMEKT